MNMRLWNQCIHPVNIEKDTPEKKNKGHASIATLKNSNNSKKLKEHKQNNPKNSHVKDMILQAVQRYICNNNTSVLSKKKKHQHFKLKLCTMSETCQCRHRHTWLYSNSSLSQFINGVYISMSYLLSCVSKDTF